MKIKDIEIKNNLILGPMAGVTNEAFRIICKEQGVGLVVTEMISSYGIYYNDQKTLELLKFDEREHPIAVQLFGDDPQIMAKAADFICKNTKYDIIDINFGCPAPKIALKSKAGSCLLKYPNQLYDIVKSVVEASTIPVTCKIRIGWDSESINGVEIAQLIEKAGASCIFVHGRTRAQGYSGHANWGEIKKIKESVKIPVVGNGDVVDYYTYNKMLEETKVDGVMIARAAMGNPWIFKDILEKKIDSFKDKKLVYETILRHYDLLKELKGEKVALLQMRGHTCSYLKGFPEAKHIKEKIVKSIDEKDFLEILKQFLHD